MQCWRIGKSVEMPALLPHRISDCIDIHGLTAKSDHRDLGVSEDIEVFREAGSEGGGEGSGCTDDLLTGLGIATRADLSD